MNIIFEIPHIKLCVSEKNETLLIIEDTEVHDFIEDVLIEKCGIVDFIHLSERIYNTVVYTIYFPKIVDTKELLKVLKGINPNEIEYLYRLNNN